MNNFKVAIVTFVLLVMVGTGFRVFDTWRYSQPVREPVVQGDTEVKPAVSWTLFKQTMYDACVDTSGGMESYCKCATNYTIDTYGVNTVASWGENIPQPVIDEVTSRCL